MRMDCGPASRNSPVLSFSCPDREPFGRSGASHLAAAAYDRVPDAPQPRKELGGKPYGLALTLAVFSVVAARNSSSMVFPPGEPYRRPTSYATRSDKDRTLSQRRPALWLSTRTDAGYIFERTSTEASVRSHTAVLCSAANHVRSLAQAYRAMDGTACRISHKTVRAARTAAGERKHQSGVGEKCHGYYDRAPLCQQVAIKGRDSIARWVEDARRVVHIDCPSHTCPFVSLPRGDTGIECANYQALRWQRADRGGGRR